MANLNVMLGSIASKIGDILSGFFAIIPQTMYFLYASIASVLDMFQYVVRKLVGLDVYYVNGTEKTGDVVIDLIEGILGINKEYSALNTVFWSMIIFGVIVLVVMTILTIIKAHYNYDAKKSSPSYILKSTVKALVTMAVIPLCTIFGLYLGSALFTALDSITNQGTESALSKYYEQEAIDNFECSLSKDKQTKRYSSYDFFGAKEWSNTQTFSGLMFSVCANNGNRVRTGTYTVNKVEPTVDPETGEETIVNTSAGSWDNVGVFYTTSDTDKVERVASQIDYAFANNLTLAQRHSVQISGMSEAGIAMGTSLTYGPSATFAFGLINVKSFSKFNVGLVWYYYNLWAFNFILAIAAVAITITLFTNIIFGLLLRIIISGALFLVYPPLVGITPFDEGNAVKSWRKEFMSYIISAYATVVAMNIMFLILPAFQAISFFNNTFLDGIIQMLFIMAGLTMVKRFVSVLTNFIGAKNLDEIGAGLKSEATKPVMAGLNTTIGFGAKAVQLHRFGNKVAGGLEKKITKDGKSKKGKIAANIVKGVKRLPTAVPSAMKFGLAKGGKALGGKLVNAFQDKDSKLHKVGENVNKALDNPILKFGLSRLGIPVDPNNKYDTYKKEVEVPDYDEDGNPQYVKDKDGKDTDELITKKVKVAGQRRYVGTDADGKPKYEDKVSGLGQIKNAVVDLSKVSFGAVLDVLGAKKAAEDFYKNSKGLDMAKQEVNEFGKAIYQASIDASNYGEARKKLMKEGWSDPIKTLDSKKEKDKTERANESVMQFQMDEQTSAVALKKIKDILNDVKKS